jgi:rod shape-determining protein MreC
VAADPGGRLRVRLAADYERLKFLRVLRHYGTETVDDSARIISSSGPLAPPTPPQQDDEP